MFENAVARLMKDLRKPARRGEVAQALSLSRSIGASILEPRRNLGLRHSVAERRDRQDARVVGSRVVLRAIGARWRRPSAVFVGRVAPAGPNRATCQCSRVRASSRPKLHRAVIPPSTRMFAPVIHFGRSDTSNATTSAMSSGDPRRPSGTAWVNTSAGSARRDAPSTRNAVDCGLARRGGRPLALGLRGALHKLVGEPPLGYLTRLRMQKAAILLREGATLAKASHLTGYASEGSFSHAFRQWAGVHARCLPQSAPRGVSGRRLAAPRHRPVQPTRRSAAD